MSATNKMKVQNEVLGFESESNNFKYQKWKDHNKEYRKTYMVIQTVLQCVCKPTE